MYSKTIIEFAFCDIRNNQGLGLRPRLITLTATLIIPDITKNLIQSLFIIVSITKFSILIGSPRAYLSRNRRAIACVSNYSCPI